MDLAPAEGVKIALDAVKQGALLSEIRRSPRAKRESSAPEPDDLLAEIRAASPRAQQESASSGSDGPAPVPRDGRRARGGFRRMSSQQAEEEEPTSGRRSSQQADEEETRPTPVHAGRVLSPGRTRSSSGRPSSAGRSRLAARSPGRSAEHGGAAAARGDRWSGGDARPA
jgi:hypothetical protein